MTRPVLFIVNGLPGTGKTTLAQRLAHDLSLPLFSRDAIYETLYTTLNASTNGVSATLGAAAFSLLYDVLASVLSAGKPALVEGFFGRPALRTQEFLALQRRCDFEPFQVLCRAEGTVLLERFCARAGSSARHAAHATADLDWLEQNRDRLLSGQLPPLALGGQLLEIDTTTPDSFDYPALLRQIRSSLP